MKAASTETEAKWCERVRAWKASGETATQFAQRHGLSVATLRAWSSRLGRQEPPHFLRVIPRAAPKSAEVFLEVDGVTIRVASGFDPDLLRAVLQALRGGSL